MIPSCSGILQHRRASLRQTSNQAAFTIVGPARLGSEGKNMDTSPLKKTLMTSLTMPVILKNLMCTTGASKQQGLRPLTGFLQRQSLLDSASWRMFLELPRRRTHPHPRPRPLLRLVRTHMSGFIMRVCVCMTTMPSPFMTKLRTQNSERRSSKLRSAQLQTPNHKRFTPTFESAKHPPNAIPHVFLLWVLLFPGSSDNPSPTGTIPTSSSRRLPVRRWSRQIGLHRPDGPHRFPTNRTHRPAPRR
jgi:hypothetical protein